MPDTMKLFPALGNDIDSELMDQVPDKDMQDILKTGSTDYKDFENNLLDEYSDKSAYEAYSGIVLDPEDNLFKTVSGMFRDKKDFYEKLSNRGYVVRKVFEKRVFDWIEKNAKNNIEAYLMFSTAFSKWKGNNLLNGYYTKLLNDIPQLNREKRKGDPNSIGTEKEEESVLDETWQATQVNGFGDRGIDTVTIIPLDREGNPDPNWEPITIKDVRFKSPFHTKVSEYLMSDPNFIHQLFQNTRKENPKAAFSLKGKDDNRSYPNEFAFKIGDKGILRQDTSETSKAGGYVTFDPEYPEYHLKRSAIGIWNTLSPDISQLNKTQQALHNYKAQDAQNKADNLVLSNMGDIEIEKQAKDIEDTEVNPEKEMSKKAQREYVKQIALSDRDWPGKISKEDHDRIISFKDDIDVLSRGTDSFRAKMLVMAYGAKSNIDAVQKAKKAFDEFLDTVEVKDDRLNNIYKTIEALKARIADVYDAPYTKADDAFELKKKLEDKLKKAEKVKKKLEKQKEKSSSNTSNNTTKGYKSKFTTTQDDLGVNQGIHGKKESADCDFNDGIPRVGDIRPVKHVNYNANIGYVDFPTTGVITSPGAFNTGGTFMTEQDEHWGWVIDKFNPELFDGTHLRPEVREALLRIAEKFKSTLGISIEPVDIYFTGSNANFTYNESSDIDLHLVYDFEQVGMNAEMLVKYFIAKKQIFNNDYSIDIRGIPVEVGVENLNEPIVSSAVYSVLNDKWLVEPEYAEQLLPRPDMKQYYDIVQEIESAIETRNSATIGKLWDKLYDIRKESLRTEGEYGKGNALFKKLRNLGYLDRLKNAYYSSASEELSLEALKEII